MCQRFFNLRTLARTYTKKRTYSGPERMDALSKFFPGLMHKVMEIGKETISYFCHRSLATTIWDKTIAGNTFCPRQIDLTDQDFIAAIGVLLHQTHEKVNFFIQSTTLL